ncbi:MAG TPA: histidine kinase [Eubacterium sp.]|jgi:two-component system sensor histidine kinase AgrC|nr:histidine kinase [Eubacterium sp.]
MLEYITDITILIIEIVCYFTFFDIFAVKRKLSKSKIIITVFLLVLFLRLCIHFLRNYTIIKILITIIIILLSMLYLYKISTIKALILTFFVQSIMTLIDYIIIMILAKLYGDITALESASALIGRLIIILSRLILFVGLIILSRISTKKNNSVTADMSDKEWIQFLIFPIFTICAVMLMTSSVIKSYHSDIIAIYYIIAIGLIVLNLVVFHLISEILENSRNMKEAEALRQQSIGQLELYNSMRENYNIQRQRTHEYKNQIVCMDMLMKKKDYSKLEDYIGNISDGLDAQLDMVDTNNDVVNAIFNAKYYEAIKNDVLVVLKINDLSDIKISDNDIVTILSNLLDNAIEAAKQCDIGKRIVKIKMLYEDAVLSIAVSNSYKAEPVLTEDGYIRTTKKDREEHGWGMRNVVATLEKYNAEYIIDYKNGEFVFSIIM